MNPIDTLIEADRTTPKRIAILGDRMTDIWIHGHLGTCQEQAMKFVEDSRIATEGGAANAWRQLENWNCRRFGMGSPRPERNIKTRFVVDDKILFRHDVDFFGEANSIEANQKSEFDRLLEAKPDACLISDYAKDFWTPAFIRDVITYANGRGIPVVADAKREPTVYKGAIIKCNKAYRLHFYTYETSRNDTLVITSGEYEPTVISNDVDLHMPKAHPYVQCVNHIGAGDSFAAHLTLALAHGLSLEDAATIAHSAGRVYVQYPHGRPPWPHEIKRDIDPLAGKILIGPDMPGLRKSIPGRIVFSNGCYDLLGAHHLYCLEKSKQFGDVLVVGVNSDESVRRLKGPKRPIQPLADRVAMLCGLSFVDWVVPFDQNDPSEIMRLLKPDIRTKGDFPELNRAGDEHAKEVRLIPPLPGYSTTNTLRKIMDS
jgi:D-beta-D-heptose 7-phosphate kinase/D-beta-D-heptose 1-phosphate adenosyltransferase